MKMKRASQPHWQYSEYTSIALPLLMTFFRSIQDDQPPASRNGNYNDDYHTLNKGQARGVTERHSRCVQFTTQLYRTLLTIDGSPGRPLGRQGSSSLVDTASQAPRRHSSPAHPPHSVSPNTHIVQPLSRRIQKAASEPDAIRAVKKVKVNAPSGS
jgi:hypothetical protein